MTGHPMDEAKRLRILEAYDVLDTPPEEALDEIVALASALCEAPIALVSLVDATRQWFKARVGLAATETPREQAFCAHVLAETTNEIFTVEDARTDARFTGNPLVTGDPNVVFYAAAPLVADGGAKLGTLCVFDRKPRRLTAVQKQALATLARLVVRHLDGRRGMAASVDAERGRLLREVESARRRLLSIFENAPAFVCTLRGPTHVFEIVNAAYHRLVGPDRRLVGLPIAVALPEAAEQGFVAIVDGVYRKGEVYHGDEVAVRLARAEGGPAKDRIVNFVYQPSRDAEGVVDGVDVFGFDVTDQVLARQNVELLSATVAAREAEMRQVMDSIPLLVSFVTADARYGMINHAYEEWFGQKREEIEGRTLRSVLGDAAWAKLSPFIRRGLDGERIDFELYDVPYVSRGTRDVKVSFIPRRGAAGGVEGYVAVIDDITVRRALEKEREIAIARLSDVLRFEQQLIGIVSHDIRNPLNVIAMSASLLTHQQGLSDDAIRLVVRIQNATGRATRLVKDLLDFTQGRLGRGIPIEPRPTDLQAVVRAVADEVEASFPSRRIEIDEAAELRGDWDPERLAQVIQNLVTNALKYSPKDTAVQLSTRGEGKDVVLVVHNSGPPIPPAQLPGLFEPFERAGQLETSARSIGLGLYIVKEIVNSHRGTVEVSSTEADGTTFTVRLPRERAPRTRR